MKATFYNLLWEKAEAPYIKQGIKGNRRPKGAMYGGNGSFVVAGEHAKLFLYVKAENGRLFHYNIYGRVMYELGRKKMSQKLFDELYEKFQNTTFTIDDDTKTLRWDSSLL